MLDQHIDDGELLSYLQDELSLEDVELVEQHVGSCVHCARRLQAEARLEATLFEVARDPTAPPAVVRRPIGEWLGRAGIGALTMAAAVLLTLTTGSRATQMEPSAPWVESRRALAQYAESRMEGQGPACIPPLSATNNICDDMVFVAQSWGDSVPWTPLEPEELAPGTRCVPVPTGDGTSIACTTEPFSG